MWRGYPHHVHVPDGWQCQAIPHTLGHHLDDDASCISSSFEQVAAAMFRSFYGNLQNGLKHASTNAKFRLLHGSVQSDANWRWAHCLSEVLCKKAGQHEQKRCWLLYSRSSLSLRSLMMLSSNDATSRLATWPPSAYAGTHHWPAAMILGTKTCLGDTSQKRGHHCYCISMIRRGCPSDG